MTASRGRPTGPGKLTKWNAAEEVRLIELWDTGDFTKRQIAEMMGKTFYSVVCKINTLGSSGRLDAGESPHQMIRRLCASVCDDAEIAQHVNITHGTSVKAARVREIRSAL